MSLRRMSGRATSLVILGICMQFASALPQGELPRRRRRRLRMAARRARRSSRRLLRARQDAAVFEANEGQADPSVRFLTRSGGYTMFLTPTETVLVEGKNGIMSREQFGKGLTALDADARNSKLSVLRMELLGANAAPEFQG